MPFDPMLNSDAVRLADNSFYDAHPEFHRKDGTRKGRNWCIGRNKTLKNEWYGYYKFAKSRLKDPRHRGLNDDVDPVAAAQPCEADAIAPYCVPMQSVELGAVTYLNDFPLFDEEEKWAFGHPQPLSGPDWTPFKEKPNPIVVYYDDKHAYDVEVQYRVGERDACREVGHLQAVYQVNVDQRDNGKNSLYQRVFGKRFKKEWYMSHQPHTKVELRPGFFKARFRGNSYPPEKIGVVRNHGSRWQAWVPPRTFEMGRPKNDVFCTWGPPVVGPEPEDGATVKRMRTAAQIAEAAKSVDEFEVIKFIFSLFPGYTLGLDHLPPERREELEGQPELLEKLTDAAWPHYLTDEQTDKGGAWLIADAPLWSAECQAICRHAMAVMHQLGAKSEIEIVKYAADFDSPATVQTDAPSGPNPLRRYSLVDMPVEIGETYWHGESPVGFNNFEAYLKVKCPGQDQPRLFGGGVGLLPEGAHPLACFKAIVEIEDVWDGDKYGRKITRMVEYNEETLTDWDGVLP